MSAKISVISISLALVSLLLFSCSEGGWEEVYRVFERPFSAEVRVENADGAYAATVALAQIGSGEDTAAASARNGNIVYTSPDSLSDISAVRSQGKVRVNVSGIEIVPSPNIAARYTFLLDLLDVRADEITDHGSEELDGTRMLTLAFLYDDSEYILYIDAENNMPLRIEGADMRITFDRFIYT